jgi:hypothetical protein
MPSKGNTTLEVPPSSDLYNQIWGFPRNKEVEVGSCSNDAFNKVMTPVDATIVDSDRIGAQLSPARPHPNDADPPEQESFFSSI